MSQSLQPAVVVDGVSKSFRDIVALQGVSFAVQRGEVFGLLGANGAGKTTLIRLIVATIKPDAGQIHVQGYSTVAEPDLVRRQLGVLTTDVCIYDRLTAY